MSINRRSRAFVFTSNNYDEALLSLLDSISCRYIVYGKEVAPTTLTQHLQGYIYFEHAKALRTVIRDIPRSHVEIARGTPDENYVYCTKGGDFIERGTKPSSPAENGRNERNRFVDAWNSAVGGRLEEIPEDIRIRYYSTLKRIAKDYQSKLDQLPGVCGIWVHGAAGSGKTRSVYETYPDAYPKPLSKWWDGYQGQSVVLLDDVDPESKTWLARFLKIWADRYPFVSEEKGGSRTIRPQKFIVTSQYSIGEIFEDVETREALGRRFIVIEKKADQNIIL